MTKRRPPGRCKPSWLLLVLLPLGLPGAQAQAKPVRKKAASAMSAVPVPLAERTPDDILDHYTFVGDFSDQPETRDISPEIFWRYPYKLPKVEFPIQMRLADPKTELPATKGSGRAVDHLNRGRLQYLAGDYLGAKATWLSGRARFGTKYPFHRRADYLIGEAFLGVAGDAIRDKHVGYDDPLVRPILANAATFLSWAFIVKTDQPDPLIDQVTPKNLYNLASIYWRYNRYAGAYGAADSGLNFLRKTGRHDYRPEFHRLMAEAHIKNRSYIEAVQELDTAIRQDRNMVQAAAAFSRVGDIYFDLNNYELAEDAYGLGARLDQELRQVNPSQLVLRGEALFWLGQFSEAQKILHYAIEGANFVGKVEAPLTDEYISWASLRIADAFLARKEIEAAKLAYFQVGHDFRGTPAGHIAQVREACLELPFYQGKNIAHARELLETAKAEVDMPPLAKELGWACQVASFTERERTPDMLDRVKKFAAVYPSSTFLQSFVEPVRSFQASHIDEYFKAGDVFSGLSFFEKNRPLLFPHPSPALQAQLFTAYADIHRERRAAEFWDAAAAPAASGEDADLALLRRATIAAELAASKTPGPWAARDRALQTQLAKHAWTLRPGKLELSYFDRLEAVAKAPGQLLWMARLARHFGDTNGNYTCDLEYPLLSRLRVAGPPYTGPVEARVAELVKKLLPDLFKADESCALSLLELEMAGLKEAGSDVIAQTYKQRSDWPLVAGFLHQYWTVAERLNDDGDSKDARQLWTVLRDKGPPNSPEVEFAKARLDKTRTEFENLWN